MPEVLVSNDDITVLGPPSSIDVQLDIGPTGQRGSKIFIGAGDPNTLTDFNNDIIFEQKIYLNDLYINNATGSEYSYMYQYLKRLGANTWVEVLKVNPAIYSLTETVSFTAGVGSISIAISDIVQNSGSPLTADNFSIQFSFGNDKVVTASITQVEITGITGQNLDITFKAIEYDSGTWIDLVGPITTHLFITIVI
jgi:hypothetical protein